MFGAQKQMNIFPHNSNTLELNVFTVSVTLLILCMPIGDYSAYLDLTMPLCIFGDHLIFSKMRPARAKITHIFVLLYTSKG